MKKNNKRSFIVALITLLIGILIGWLLFGSSSNLNKEPHSHETENVDQIWTCSMHPQIRKTEEGDCPICGMELIPLSTDNNSDENQSAIKMSQTAMQLANVQTAVVQSGKAVKVLKLTGKITPDERVVFSQTSHISGRIERLMINYTGEVVREGQVIAAIYSPELMTAQEELLIAFENKETQPELLIASKEKLRNWKLTEGQINKLIESGKPMDEFPILSDLNGVVISKFKNRGNHIKEGETFYEVANLSRLWVLLDVHESDLAWIKEGDIVKYKINAFPNKSFQGKIDFIDPVINPKTRVAKARIELDNSSKNFKPQMLVNATVESKLKLAETAIIVPKSAVMWTGERSLVYVKTNAKNGIHFIMREVELGTSLGDSYIISSGLEVGEEIAVNGTFSIDAAAQLAGKPSMMNPEGVTMNLGHNHGGETPSSESSFEVMKASNSIEISETQKLQIRPILESYFRLKNALTEDDFEQSKVELEKLSESIKQVNMKIFKEKTHNSWMTLSSELKSNVKVALSGTQIEEVRKSFIAISKTILQLNKFFDPLNYTTYVQHCPMANNNKGADWLSKEEEIKNPYFGSSMLTCGEVKSKKNK